ncbi:MAG TPA: Rrf2 family transcriptional regulator, partial [Candidatus Acidoferrales bacterium]|nr:Rrf2 family transcriptional regulator [Candidatus Acidoferrales bacterium]
DRVTSAELAESVNTNPVIVRRLLLALQEARLVETRKGAGAGSRLSRSPRRINLAEVYQAVESAEPFATPSRKPNAACPVGHFIRHTLDQIFASAAAALEGDLRKTKLADVIEAIKASGACGSEKAVPGASWKQKAGSRKQHSQRQDAQGRGRKDLLF